ncbi:hypothetical protein Scep_028096 [Stephania cephalantha]|uniref:Uncharacterized protein n=1 Tax=Stephania cephalantha TaxID=152367 RepID=A0AAP0E994_9MAGN
METNIGTGSSDKLMCSSFEEGDSRGASQTGLWLKSKGWSCPWLKPFYQMVEGSNSPLGLWANGDAPSSAGQQFLVGGALLPIPSPPSGTTPEDAPSAISAPGALPSTCPMAAAPAIRGGRGDGLREGG